jgi:plasmid stability protein
MATLYVENIPDELYAALKARARERNKSISAEVIALLSENVPTQQELKHRRELLHRARKIRSTRIAVGRVFPTAEEMQRQDRSR